MAFGNVDIGVRYIKISKIDENGVDQTNSLQELQEITIPFSDIGNKTYKITNTVEYPDYFLYEIEANVGITSQTSSLNYIFTSSLSNSIVTTSPLTVTSKVISSTPIEDNLGFYNGGGTFSGYYLSTYPQNQLNVTISGSFTVTANGVELGIINGNQFSLSTTDPFLTSSIYSTGSHNINYTYPITNPTPGKGIRIGIRKTGSFSDPNGQIQFSPGSQFIITSTPTAESSSITMVLEPYLVNNFSKAYDCQPLLNNAVELRFNKYLQDVDYSSNALVPVNFNVILSGSATRASVPLSNYTSLSSINPRYKGTKNQTEKINEWTDSPSNEGNFGKEPSIDSKTGLISYCTTGGGLQPDYMDAVEVRIKYIIKDSDTVISPNVNEPIIRDVQNAYPTNGFVRLSPIENSGDPDKKFKIIRGGQRILPIFYNQSQSLAELQWVDLIEFTNIAQDVSTVVENKTVTLGASSQTILPTTAVVEFDNILSQGDDITPGPSGELGTTNKYTVTQDVLDNVNQLIFNTNIDVTVQGGIFGNSTVVEVSLLKNGIVVNSTFQNIADDGSGIDGTLTLNNNFNLTQLSLGDVFEYQISKNNSVTAFITTTSRWIVSQEPYPTSPVSSSNLFFTSSLDPNTIYSTSSQLVQYYGNPDLRQEDIANSGFFNIQFPFEFQLGDQVRFEGLERNTYEIIEAGIVSGSFPSSSLEIKLNQQISGSGIDINKFVFRRFIEDGGAITIKLDGKSLPTAPYYAFPEYITDELSVDLDTLTSILVNKGLIT